MHYLFLVRHYPPEISGGARRPFLLVRALRKLGYKITLVTPFELEEDPDQIHVVGEAIRLNPDLPYLNIRLNAAAHVKNFLRNWILWPEPDIRWSKRVERVILESGIKPDGIFTTSPPESIHVVGARLARKLDVPWVAEFRDTWFYNSHRKIIERSLFRRFIERYIAKKALKNVSGLTAVSNYVMNDVLSFAPNTVPRQIIGHFSTPQTEKYNLPQKDLNLVHSGGFTLSDRGRYLEPLLDIFEEASIVRPELHLHIAGRLTKDEQDIIASSSVRITYHGQVSLMQSQAMQCAADGLVLYTPKQSHALPGKYAEYCFANRPILYLGGGDWMNLVENPEGLRPLYQGLTELKKDEHVINFYSISDDKAAEMLGDLFKRVSRKN